MKSGEKLLVKEKRILNRIYILSEIDNIIKESVYYRTYSDEFYKGILIAKIPINLQESKTKIL